MNMLQSLMRRKPVRTRHISIFEACGNYLSQPPPTPPPPPPQSVPAAPLEGELKRYENPCLDLFYNIIIHKPASHVHLKRLLPPAWSHNPLTTLKIIRSLHDPLLEDEDVFFEACYWLHHNHPKTLAYNLPYIMDSELGCHYTTFIEILYRVLELKQVPHIGYKLQHVKKINEAMELIEDGLTIKLSARQKKLIPEIDRIREMYERDLDFRFLHNRVADLFAESIKFDIENLLKVQRQQLNHEEVDEILEVTWAADDCDCAPFLLESVAKRIYPERHKYKDDEHYRYRVLKRFRNDVLDPLMKVMNKDTYDRDDFVNPSGYINVSGEFPRPSYYDLALKYLEEVKESSDKMFADALTPHELVHYVIEKDSAGDADVGQVVELQWKAMVEDLKKKYKDKNMGILSHSLAAIEPGCQPFSDNGIQLAMALTILVSELSEVEAWKGKAIHLILNPGLLSIQGHDLNSKCEFLSNLTSQTKGGRRRSRRTDFKRMFDLILEEALSWSLKPEQMIKRVFVFTDYNVFERISGGRWEAQDYEEMRSKYKEHGYDMPHIVFWRLGEYLEHVQQYSTDQRGVAIMSGFCQHQTRSAGANLVRMFLENDGDLTPQHVMEAILCGGRDDHYSHLAVLD